MTAKDRIVVQESVFSVRPRFLAGCAVVVLLLFLPDLVSKSYFLKLTVLWLAILSVLLGWLALLKDGGPNERWRSLISTIAASYLIVSLPVFLFEISQLKWLMRHPWHHGFSMFVRPWVHWGFVFILLSVILSFFGKGRSRVAFVTASLLLLVLHLATGTWVY